ncbi:MAG: immunoglobulin domain-containing protein [Chitinispirillaceae bacterium]|nr:immunoglobulin domain-containing protein [Chitinispirillaceae bacterium]
MRKTALLFCLVIVSLLWLLCSTPTNPFEDYSNCKIAIVSPGQADTVCLVYDTVSIAIRVDGATMFSALTLYIGKKDSVTVTSFASSWTQTVEVEKVFQLPDTVELTVKAILKNQGRLDDTLRIIVAGRAPLITLEPPDSIAVEIGAACSVSVAATGVPPLTYIWTKNGSLLPDDTAATFKIGNFQGSDSGVYRCIVSTGWGSDTSRPMRLTVKKQSGKTIYWNFAFYRDTVQEGDSTFIRLDSLYSAPASDTISLGMLETVNQAALRGDSLFVFHAGARDSGSYLIPVRVSSKSGADTAMIVVTVAPRYHTLTLIADSGSITVTPAAVKYRWSDTVSLKAQPDSGFRFSLWSGDASGLVDTISLVVLRDMTVRARFISKDSSGCIQITAGSLNQAIRSASPGSVRPKSICPAQGAYDQGTVKIWGTVRFVIQ